MLIDGYDIDVTVRKNCRRLIMRVREGKITMSVPPGIPKRTVETFVRDRQAWIDMQMQKSAPVFQPAYAAGERHLVLGEYRVLGQGAPVGEKALQRWRATQLSSLVERLLPVWTARLGVRPKEIRYRLMKSRWGSCQCTTGKITLNSKLALLPPQCVEYVLAHELCHLIHPDHSPRFYAALAQVMPDWQARREQLNRMDLRPLPAQ